MVQRGWKQGNKEQRERDSLALGKERGIVTTLDPVVSCGSLGDGPQQLVVGSHPQTLRVLLYPSESTCCGQFAPIILY